MSSAAVSVGSFERSATSRAHGLAILIRAHPLVSYFLLVYGMSWLVWLPYVLSPAGLGLLTPQLPTIYIALGAFVGPCLAGFVMTGIVGGRRGVGLLLRRFLVWRVGLQWYAFAIFCVPAVAVLGALLLPGALAALSVPSLITSWLTYPVVLVLTFLIDGGGEEPGWRGFALPRLQSRYGPLGGTLVLGLLWAGWHFPLVLTTSYGGGPGGNLTASLVSALLFVPAVTFNAIVITWVFNNTRGSLLIAMLVHGAFDATPLPSGVVDVLTSHYPPLLPPIVGVGLLAVAVLVSTRGRLAYDRYQRDTQLLEMKRWPAPRTR